MDLCKRHKYKTIHNWKSRGLIHDDIDMLYKEYINTFNCNHCHKEFTNTKDRCLDHCHITGKFRKIVCNACNVNDNYIKYPNGVPNKKKRDSYINYPNGLPSLNERGRIKYNQTKERHKDKNKKYYEINKEKQNEKFTCECGGKYTHQYKGRHFKTKKHLSYKQILLGL